MSLFGTQEKFCRYWYLGIPPRKCLYSCAGKSLRWPSMIPASLYSCSWVISSLWVWFGFSDSLLMNRIRQKWGDATSKIRLRKTVASGLWTLSHSLALREINGHVATRRDLNGKKLMSLTNSQQVLTYQQSYK